MTNYEISLRTKEALSDALVRAMQQKSFGKITVGQLIAECGVNRNTFYYHFRDIYDLLHWTLDRCRDSLMEKLDPVNNIYGTFLSILDYLESNEKIVLSICDSIGYAAMKQFMVTCIAPVIDSALEWAESRASLDSPCDASYKRFLSTFYSEALSGLLLDWISRDPAIEVSRDDLVRNLVMICSTSLPNLLVVGPRSPKENMTHEKHK